MTSAAPPGWYPDQQNAALLRWWDGTAWTTNTAPAAPAVAPPPTSVARAPRVAREPRVARAPRVAPAPGSPKVPRTLRRPSTKVAAIAISGAAVVTVASIGVGLLANPPHTVAVAAPTVTVTQTVAPSPTPTPSWTDTDDAVVAITGTVATVHDRSVTEGRTAVEVLATLEVKGRAAKTGYTRDQFGQTWLDVNRNGCDTRNDILGAQLTDVVRSGPCKVLSGTLADPYTGATTAFVRGQGTSELVQIDHVVALSDAWQKGAQQLTPEQRETFANDPLNLLATDGATNQQKGDGDAATWLPANKPFRCTYVARQVSVKATYGLWVTPAEHDAIARILTDCPTEPAVTSTYAAAAPAPVAAQPSAAATPAPVAPAAPAAPAAPPADVTYANCAAVRAAGAAPLYAGQPGYSTKLDRDKDGVACES